MTSMPFDAQAHWDAAYERKGERGVSWFEEDPAPSLDLIAQTGIGAESAIIDIGGGASRLVDSLLDKGFRRLTVLDLSDVALAIAEARLGARGNRVRWLADDITRWNPEHGAYDLWHDRAAFHFLAEPDERTAYVERMSAAIKPGGHAIIATFAPDGPERCSGLPVTRYDPEGLARTIGDGFELIATRRHVHRTPWGSEQKFQFSLLRRR